MILVNCETVGPKLLVIISSWDFLLHSCVPIAWLRRWFVVVKHLSTLATFSGLVTIAQFSANPNLFPSWCWIHLPQPPPPPTRVVNGIRKIDSATVQHPTIGTFAVYSLSESCLLPPVILHFEWLGTDVHLDVPYLRGWVPPAHMQDSYLKSRGFDSHPGLESWRSSWVRKLWHDFARSEFRIPMKWPVFRCVFFCRILEV